MEELAIEARGLTKAFGATRVLEGIDLAVPRGQVFALLGPNGAGKTTTVRILATVATADSGTARVAGHDVVTGRREVRRRISLTGQFAALDEAQTGTENLQMMARLRHLPRPAATERTAELLARFDLVDAADRRVQTYSGGMRRRLDLAVALLSRPEVVFLDEPTNGLDPRSRHAVWEIVAELAGSGVTVFLTTQYLEEADRLARRIAVLDGGRLVAEGSADALKAKVAGQRLDLQLADLDAYDGIERRLAGRVVHRDRPARTLGLATDGTAAEVRAVLDELDPDRRLVDRFELHRASLDDVFLALTGRSATTRPSSGAATDHESEPSHV